MANSNCTFSSKVIFIFIRESWVRPLAPRFPQLKAFPNPSTTTRIFKYILKSQNLILSSNVFPTETPGGKFPLEFSFPPANWLADHITHCSGGAARGNI